MTCSSCHAGPDELHTTVRDGHADVANRFELIGAHGSIICGACHVVGGTALRFSPINQADCVACHQANYETQHASTSYPTTCLTCHTMDAWAATFDHETRSGGFALLGAHADLACTSCHDATTFAPLFSPESDTNCIACHQTDYDTQHAGTSYPTTCLTCHTTDGWATMFDHETKSGGFALLGVHADLVCTSCHDAVTFAPLFSPENHTDCFACHETDYEAQHSTAGYPTTCLTCHTTQSWTPSSFDHDGDYFPIFTGEHAPRWSGCATCHTDPDDFTVFTCFNCHAHDATPMNQKHAGISGYSYDSAACYTCHPDGKGP